MDAIGLAKGLSVQELCLLACLGAKSGVLIVMLIYRGPSDCRSRVIGVGHEGGRWNGSNMSDGGGERAGLICSPPSEGVAAPPGSFLVLFSSILARQVVILANQSRQIGMVLHGGGALSVVPAPSPL